MKDDIKCKIDELSKKYPRCKNKILKEMLINECPRIEYCKDADSFISGYVFILSTELVIREIPRASAYDNTESLNHLRDEYYEWDRQATVSFRKAERIKNRIDRNFQRYHMPNSAIYIRLSENTS